MDTPVRLKLDAFHQKMRELMVPVLELRISGKLEEANKAGEEVDAMLATHDGELCEQCGDIFCPWGEPLHFHHDGCPCCALSPETLEDSWWEETGYPRLLARNK